MSDILKKAQAKGGINANRLAAALVAFDKGVPFEGDARLMLVGAALGLSLAEVKAALDELVNIGAAQYGWVQ